MNADLIPIMIVGIVLGIIFLASDLLGRRRMNAFRNKLQPGQAVRIKYFDQWYEGTIINTRMGLWEVMFDGVQTVMKSSEEIYPPNHRTR